MPVARSVEVAKSEDRNQNTEVRRQKTEGGIKEKAQKTEIATPITQPVERAQTRREARRQIVTPLSQTTEVAATEVRNQGTGDRKQRTEDSVKQETQRAEIATPIAPSVESAPAVTTQNHGQDARATRTEVRRQESGDRIREATKQADVAVSPKTEKVPQQRAAAAGVSNEHRRLAPKNPISMTPENPISMKPQSVQKLTPENPISMTPKNPISLRPESETKLTAANNERRSRNDESRSHREKIVRGTAGHEIGMHGTGKTMNVERAVSGFDGGRQRRGGGETTINNNNTIVNNVSASGGHSGKDRDRHYGGHDRKSYGNHHSGWWNKGGYGGHHNSRDKHHGHRSSFFLSLGFYSGYAYSAWAPVYYEPAVCTTVAYAPVWPSHYRTIVYGYGPHYGFSYVYPSHHRRYVFMSVGGYWPCYSYARYYWYDYHPWYWYGAAPVAYQVGGGDTYNYYTYNYYGSGNTVESGGALKPGTIINGVEVPDYDALKAAGQKASPPAEKPAEPTEADKLFDEGVAAFGDGNYPAAIEKFRRAVRIEPDDVILPFAYAQALFANTDYEQAAAVLQTALTAMAPAKPEVFFPRGLYKDDAVLTEQIKSLERAVMMNPANSGLQLLYGYQLLGIGKADDAKVPLGVAQRDARTASPASTLLNLIDRVKAESQTKK
jgi:Tfp pilus assembly protein PilF